MELIGPGIRRPYSMNHTVWSILWYLYLGSLTVVVQGFLTRHILADMLDEQYDKNHELFDLEHMKIEALILQKNTMEIISPGIN